MAIIFHGEQSRTIGQNAKPQITEKQAEMFQRMEEGTYLYLETLSPMAAQKAADALRKQQGFNGKFMKRCQWVAENFWNIERIDHDKQEIWFKSGTYYTFKDVTKTVVDYIEWLNSKKGE